jgi:hypothetical protein
MWRKCHKFIRNWGKIPHRCSVNLREAGRGQARPRIGASSLARKRPPISDRQPVESWLRASNRRLAAANRLELTRCCPSNCRHYSWSKDPGERCSAGIRGETSIDLGDVPIHTSQRNSRRHVQCRLEARDVQPNFVAIGLADAPTLPRRQVARRNLASQRQSRSL